MTTVEWCDPRKRVRLSPINPDPDQSQNRNETTPEHGVLERCSPQIGEGVGHEEKGESERDEGQDESHRIVLSRW